MQHSSLRRHTFPSKAAHQALISTQGAAHEDTPEGMHIDVIALHRAVQVGWGRMLPSFGLACDLPMHGMQNSQHGCLCHLDHNLIPSANHSCEAGTHSREGGPAAHQGYGTLW